MSLPVRPTGGYSRTNTMLWHVSFISASLLVSMGLFATAAPPKKEKPKEPVPNIILSMPLDICPGTKSILTLRGRNLDKVTAIRLHEPKAQGTIRGVGKKVPVPTKADPSQVGDSEIQVEIILPNEISGNTISISLIGPGGESSPHRLIIQGSTVPVMEKEPNDGFKTAQKMAVPGIVSGAIQSPQDVDMFQFEAEKGERLFIDVRANRFGSPLDGLLAVYDSTGNLIAEMDDAPATVDPILELLIPRSGRYYLSLIDAHDQGGSFYIYQIAITKKKNP